MDKKPSVFQRIFWVLLVCLLFAGSAVAVVNDSDFFDLCAEGTLEQVISAINDGADVNAKENASRGRSPLLYAAAYNTDPEVIKALINAGADVNARTEEGWSLEGGITPLMLASANSNLEAIRSLIDAGADVNARNRAGWSPLLLASGSNNSNLEAIRVLIDAGADVNAHDGEGSTPLTLAAERCSNPEVIAVLLDSGAKPEKKQVIIQSRGDNKTMYAIDFARNNEHLQNTEVLKRLEDETRSGLLAEKRDLEFSELCIGGSLLQIDDAIKNGANVNARLENERTPLMLAAKEVSDPEVIWKLIGAGADVQMRDENKYTPLMFAANYNSNPQITAALIEAGADVNDRANGFTPLMVAAFSNSNPEVTATLLERGADPKAKNKGDKDNMALSYARRNRNLKNTDVLKQLEELSVEN